MRKILWGVFAVWNLFLLFVILGRKPQVEEIIEKPVSTQTYVETLVKRTEISMPQANYSFVDSGGFLDEVTLKDYRAEVDSDKKVKILSDFFRSEGSKIDVAWQGNTALPEDFHVWNIKQENNSLVMSWENKDQVIFRKVWIVGEDYSIRLNVEIENKGKKTVRIRPIITLTKKKFEPGQSFVFRGISSFLNGTLKNLDPENLSLDIVKADKGWVGFNEKYWLIAYAGGDFSKVEVEKKKDYTIQIYKNELQIDPDRTGYSDSQFFAGPKDIKVIKDFEDRNKVTDLEKSLDYGWFFFLTKPMNAAMNFLIEKVSSVGLALVLMTLILKFISWPITARSNRAMVKMKELAPRINDLKILYKDDSQLLNQQIFALYKKEGVNPLSGCLPVLLQIPLFFPLYKVLSISIAMRFAPFPFWIQDLSVADPTTWSNLFGLLPFAQLPVLKVGAWPILMGISMFIQQRFSSSTETENHMMTYGLPILFTWMMSTVPAGVVIYWTLTNFLNILQILWEKRKVK